jgi:hypothetical protein
VLNFYTLFLLPLSIALPTMKNPPLVTVISVAVILALAINAYALAGASQSLQALLGNVQVSTLAATSASTPSDRAALKSAVLAGNFTPRLDSSKIPCPVSCNNAGINLSAWFVYSSIRRLELCTRPMLLSFALLNQLDDPENHVKISACTADLAFHSGIASTINGSQVSGHGIMTNVFLTVM